MVLPLIYELAIIALSYALFTVVIQRLLINFERNFELQQKIKLKQQEVSAVAKSNPTGEDFLKKQNELSMLMMENLKGQWKPMIILIPCSLILYYYLLPHAFTGMTVTIASITLSYRLFFIVIAAVSGIVLQLVLQQRDKKKYGPKYAAVASSLKEANIN